MYSTLFFVMIVVVILLFMTVFSCVPPVPYVSSGFFPALGASSYHEGFGPKPKPSREGFGSAAQREGFSEYTTYPDHAAKDTVVDIAGGVGGIGECSKYQGFDGLFCTPASAHASNPTDIFSQAAGRSDCKSYGYMNSRGFLCMDDKQVQLLTTRGGNASGGDMQIGQVVKK